MLFHVHSQLDRRQYTLIVHHCEVRDTCMSDNVLSIQSVTVQPTDPMERTTIIVFHLLHRLDISRSQLPILGQECQPLSCQLQYHLISGV
jgi:hypothetical protein